MNLKAVYRPLIYVGVFILFTLFFLVVNFPSEKLTGQINKWILPASKGALAAGNARIKLPLSLEVGEITLKLDHGSLDLGKAVVRPHILEMLGGKKGADVSLESSWLDATFSVAAEGQSLDLEVTHAVIDLSGLPQEILPVPLDLVGEVELSMGLFSKDLTREVSTGDVRITSGPVSVGGDLLRAVGFTPLKIASISVFATVEDNVATLGENAIEGDINATARGVIRLTPANFMASRLDLALQVKPDPGSQERLEPVFSLIGARIRSDGSINLRIRGTVSKPSITM
jgi:type II secretion system protein N